ncbi:MAG TPA: hypothetical protein VGJ79_11965 [Candidatus Dormibacteraeota bacterium]
MNATLRLLAPSLILAILCACGGTAPAATQPSPATCDATGTASVSWPLPQPPPSSNAPVVSATASGDTLTFSFTAGTPPFQVITQSGTLFAEDPSGKRVTLAGTDGVRIVLTGFRGDQINYKGEKKLTSTGPRLLEVAELGDFEGNLSWGVGLNGPSCATVTTNGATLTFQFIPDA